MSDSRIESSVRNVYVRDLLSATIGVLIKVASGNTLMP